jgi:hypothetical protein
VHKKIFKHIAQFRYVFLFASAVLLVSIILALGWINHFDFKRSVINAELKELMIIAKSTSRDIENRDFGIKQEPEQIAKLVEHINNEEMLYSSVMDHKYLILSHPVKRFIGKDIFEVSREVLNARELSRLNAFLKSIETQDCGAAVLYFPSNEEKKGKTQTLLAFSRIRSHNTLYLLIIAERLDALTKPMHRNLLDTLVLMGLSLLLLSTFGTIFYRIQKKKIRMEVATIALEIINKQLHCEIEDYKSIEKKLNKYRR